MKKFLVGLYQVAIFGLVGVLTYRTFHAPEPTAVPRSTEGLVQQAILNSVFDATSDTLSVRLTPRGSRSAPAYPLTADQIYNLAFDDTTDSLTVNLDTPVLFGDGLYLFGNKTTLSDDSSVTFPIGAGLAWVMCGDRTDFGEIAYGTLGNVTGLQMTANFTTADTDGTCAVFGNSSTVTVKNRLGSSQVVSYFGAYR